MKNLPGPWDRDAGPFIKFLDEKTKFNAGEAASSQTMGLSPQAFYPTKERIDENHPWVTDDANCVEKKKLEGVITPF